MKNFIKLFFTFFISYYFISCENNNDNIEHNFENSVAILDNHNSTNNKTNKSGMVAHTIELINCSDDYQLNEAYKINDIEFNDNGLFNDLVANDGIYTSVELFETTDEEVKTQNGAKLSLSKDFKYKNQLIDILNDRYSNNKGPGISVSCDIVVRPCPQTTWYNSCYISDQCNCIYLENCSASLSWEF